MNIDVSSLAHTKFNCKYHVVFAPKYRRQVIYGKIKKDIGVMFRKLCQYKGVEIIKAEACPDHIHMLLSIPPKYSGAQILGYLKGKTFMGYFTGENGTGEQITDKLGKSLKPWVIKENNHYYKPYKDYITDEDDYGLKLYAYYI